MEWKASNNLVPYEEAVAFMEERARLIHEGTAQELVWFVEHPPLYTAGTSADDSDLLQPRFPVHRTGRGGQYTYHGPGQRIAYVMLNLQNRGQDLRRYVQQLETWIIHTLADFGIKGEIREGRVGVWVKMDQPISTRGGVLHDDPAGVNARSAEGAARPLLKKGSESKIAALGVRVRKWVTYHGIALNVNPDLEHYTGIIPCGVTEFGVTSLHALGINATMQQVDESLRNHFGEIFNK